MEDCGDIGGLVGIIPLESSSSTLQSMSSHTIKSPLIPLSTQQQLLLKQQQKLAKSKMLTTPIHTPIPTPTFNLHPSINSASKIAQLLKVKLLFQDSAATCVADFMYNCISVSPISTMQTSINKLHLVGPSSTGKTELVHAVSKLLGINHSAAFCTITGSDYTLNNINQKVLTSAATTTALAPMTTLTSSHPAFQCIIQDINRCFQAATEENVRPIVFFDEFDQMIPEVQYFIEDFLDGCNYDKYTTVFTDKVKLRNAMIFFSSNYGSDDIINYDKQLRHAHQSTPPSEWIDVVQNSQKQSHQPTQSAIQHHSATYTLTDIHVHRIRTLVTVAKNLHFSKNRKLCKLLDNICVFMPLDPVLIPQIVVHKLSCALAVYKMNMNITHIQTNAMDAFIPSINISHSHSDIRSYSSTFHGLDERINYALETLYKQLDNNTRLNKHNTWCLLWHDRTHELCLHLREPTPPTDTNSKISTNPPPSYAYTYSAHTIIHPVMSSLDPTATRETILASLGATHNPLTNTATTTTVPVPVSVAVPLVTDMVVEMQVNNNRKVNKRTYDTMTKATHRNSNGNDTLNLMSDHDDEHDSSSDENSDDSVDSDGSTTEFIQRLKSVGSTLMSSAYNTNQHVADEVCQNVVAKTVSNYPWTYPSKYTSSNTDCKDTIMTAVNASPNLYEAIPKHVRILGEDFVCKTTNATLQEVDAKIISIASDPDTQYELCCTQNKQAWELRDMTPYREHKSLAIINISLNVHVHFHNNTNTNNMIINNSTANSNNPYNRDQHYGYGDQIHILCNEIATRERKKQKCMNRAFRQVSKDHQKLKESQDAIVEQLNRQCSSMKQELRQLSEVMQRSVIRSHKPKTGVTTLDSVLSSLHSQGQLNDMPLIDLKQYLRDRDVEFCQSTLRKHLNQYGYESIQKGSRVFFVVNETEAKVYKDHKQQKQQNQQQQYRT